MKKLLLTSAVIALTSMAAYSQGVVAFVNNTATRISFGNNVAPGDTPGAFLPTGSRFLIGLYYAPEGPDPTDAGMLNVMGAGTPVAPLAGRYNGGNRTTPGTTAPGGNAWFQVRAWESAFGTDYETAFTSGPRDVNGTTRLSLTGKSSRFLIATGSGSAPGQITAAGGVGPFSAEIVPEPSTIALGILGGLGTLVLFRRRK